MRAHALAAILLAAGILAGCAAPTEDPEAPRLPRSMAALGDSITRGMNPDGAAPGDHPEVSWATGNASLARNASHAERLRQMGALEEGARNFAQSGARIGDFARQARLAVDARAEYVTVLFGANDACARRASAMTSVEAFRAAFRDGARVLDDGLPRGATVYVVSIPDVEALRALGANDSRAQLTWAYFRICPALLGPDASEEERAEVAARVAAYNAVLREESAAFGFAHDGGAAHAAEITAADVSDLDYFHPSFRGQARLAAATWEAGPFAEQSLSERGALRAA